MLNGREKVLLNLYRRCCALKFISFFADAFDPIDTIKAITRSKVKTRITAWYIIREAVNAQGRFK